MQTMLIVLATAYMLLAIGSGMYCGRMISNEHVGLALLAVAILLIATLIGLNREQVALFWQVLVAGFASYFLSFGTWTLVG